MKKRSTLPLCCLLFMFVVGLTAPLTPTYASPTGNIRYVTEVGTFANLFSVDVDSQGRVFVLADNDVYRSVDNGQTWTKVFDHPDGASTVPQFLMVDSRDYIHSIHWNSTISAYDVYRSTDNGDTWVKTASNIGKSWHISEAPNGDLYFNLYASYNAKIYRSTDAGASWQVFYDPDVVYGRDFHHFHSVRVNPYDGNVWVALEVNYTTSEFWIQRYNGTQWITVFNATTWGNTDFFFDENYVYLCPDFSEDIGDGLTRQRVYRIPHSATSFSPPNEEYVWDGRYAIGTGVGYVWYAENIDGIFLFGTVSGQLWGSWDGEHWVKIFEPSYTGTRVHGLYWLSRRHPIYIVDADTDKLYRVDIQKSDLFDLYYETFRQIRGKETNQATYVLEQRIRNGTNYVDFSHVALKDVQVSIVGLSRKNYGWNMGFETGDGTDWSIWWGADSGTWEVTTTEKYEGSYSLKITHNSTNAEDKWFRNYRSGTGYYTTDTVGGDIVIVSIYAKANTSLTNGLRIQIVNHTSGGGIVTKYYDLTTSWQRYTIFWVNYKNFNGTSTPIRVWFHKVAVGVASEVYFDAILFEVKHVELAHAPKNENSIFMLNENPFSTYFSRTINTTNLTITIAGQQISYSGELANGTETPATSLSGILTGAIKVEANIGGSGQAILKITGTRILYEDSIILQGRKANVYYGRYYGTFSPTTTTNNLIAVTNLASNITTLSYGNNKLTLTINAPTGTTSTTEIYTASKGKPTSVTGATSWSYDGGTKLLTLTASHSSSVTITIDWTTTSTSTSSQLNFEQLINQLTYAVLLLGTISVIYKLLIKASKWES